MIIYKVGGKFFGYPEIVKKLSKEIANSSDQVLIVISAVKEITRILKMLNLVNTQLNLTKSFRTEQFNFLYGLFNSIHIDLIDRLFLGEDKKNTIDKFDGIFCELKNLLDENYGTDIFHQVLHFGELTSSMIYHRYYNSIGIENVLINAPDYVVTTKNGDEIIEIKPIFENFFSDKRNKLSLTQGFIGKNIHGAHTTIGDDGSDYSAAKIAEFLHKRDFNVQLMVYLKDVLGVYPTDPKLNPFTQVIREINWHHYEKISGEKFVVRMDAISTLVSNKIPTTIRSFLDWSNAGTRITS